MDCETFFVPIDRATFRKNPDAGRTATFHGYHWAERTLEFAAAGSIGTQKQVSSGAPIGIEGEGRLTFAKWTDTERQEQFSRQHRTVSEPRVIAYQLHQEGEWHEHPPLPQWLFGYMPTFVRCCHCGKQFLHTLLDDDYTDDGDLLANVCPKCGKADCCELDFEKPEAVAEEMGLTKTPTPA